MRIMSLRRFIQKASEPQEVLAMPVREFLNAIATQCEDTCTAIVTLDSPEPNSISVKFFPPGVERVDAENLDAPPDQREPRITRFSWSMAELKEDLGNWADDYTVDISLDSSQPGKIWMKFVKGNDGCED